MEEERRGEEDNGMKQKEVGRRFQICLKLPILRILLLSHIYNKSISEAWHRKVSQIEYKIPVVTIYIFSNESTSGIRHL